MQVRDDHFELSLASSADDVRAAQALRYRVFVEELGADGPMVDHRARLEADRFDAFADHLILRDRTRQPGTEVVGVYRLLRAEQAAAAGGFYSDAEYDLSALCGSGRRLMELGRSCLDPAYRGSTALLHLWQGLSSYVARHRIDVMFGVASFAGTDIGPLAQSLSLLHHRHLAPAELRPVARPRGRAKMDLIPATEIDRAAAMRAIPALIKSYLRLGGMVGDGAWIDAPFNCIDICLVLDTARMTGQPRRLKG